MHADWEKEIKRLDDTEKEIAALLLEKMGRNSSFKREMRTINKEMWENVGVLSGHSTFDMAPDFMQEITFLKRNLIDTDTNSKEIKKLERLLQSPYFSRIDFGEEDCDEESLYIGIYGLRKEATGEFLIYDWRAPVSSMFYDYEPGAAQYECPGGYIKGVLLNKRQYRIEKGKLLLMFDSNIAIGDQILQDILAGSADNRMKTIVSTIQKEQNRAIRSEEKRILAVQGPAGSGKTSIAMHRAAYLLYRHRNNIRAENICLFTPNGIFAKYISSILPELGEDDIPSRTMTGFCQSALKNRFVKYESYADMMEWQLSANKNDEFYRRIDYIRYKASRMFVDLVEEFVAGFENSLIQFEDIVYEETVFSSGEELADMFKTVFSKMPAAKRLARMKLIVDTRLKEFEKQREKERMEELAAVGEYINAGEIKEKAHLKVSSEMEGVRNKIRCMLTIDIVSLYLKVLERLETIYAVENGNRDGSCNFGAEAIKKGMLPYEDQVPVLYLMTLLGMIDPDNEIKHVIIDEAQDYSEIAYKLISRIYPTCGITLLGDISQNINPISGIGSLQRAGEIIDSNNLEFLELDKSYRSTVEIMEFASRILDTKAMPYGRHGKYPSITRADSAEGVYALVEECVRGARRENMNSIAVICRTLNDCRQVYSQLNNLPVSLVQNGDEEIPAGIVVIPSYLAKGLEFDAVIAAILQREDYAEKEEQLFYTVCTRALHMLNICAVNNSEILQRLEL